MNWGGKIALVYIGFVLMMLVLVFLSSQKTFHMVTENYYEEEIKYQERIDKIQNSKSLKLPLKIEQNEKEEMIFIQFPDSISDISGKIRLFRPSDSGLDKELEIRPDSRNRQAIFTPKLTKGYWKVIVEWQSAGVNYYDESPVFIR